MINHDELTKQGFTSAGIEAIEAGLDPSTLPPPPSLAESLAMAIVVPKPWSDDYRTYVESLKQQFRATIKIPGA